jgi:hypothetical protein
MKSHASFYLALYALAVALLLSGCVAAGGFISIPRLPTDMAADMLFSGEGALYVYGPIAPFSLPVASTHIDSARRLLVIDLKDFNAYWDVESFKFAAEPCRNPKDMIVEKVQYSLDGKEYTTVHPRYNNRDGHPWIFHIENQRCGDHELRVSFTFADPMRRELKVVREVRLKLLMRRSVWDN